MLKFLGQNIFKNHTPILWNKTRKISHNVVLDQLWYCSKSWKIYFKNFYWFVIWKKIENSFSTVNIQNNKIYWNILIPSAI